MKIIEPAKCCFCVPLRQGLLFLGYLKLVTSLFLTTIQYSAARDIQGLICLMVPVIDTAFNAIFVFAGHKKHIKLYQTFYYYSFISFVLFIWTFALMFFGFDSPLLEASFMSSTMEFNAMLPIANQPLVVNIGFDICNMLFQVYVLLLVRSQVNKLKESLECDSEDTRAAAKVSSI